MEGSIFPAVSGGGAVALLILGVGLTASRTRSMRLMDLIGPPPNGSRASGNLVAGGNRLAVKGFRVIVGDLCRRLPVVGWGKAREAEDLPFLLDLMVIASDSGMNMFQVIEVAGAYVRGPLSESLRKAREEFRLGRPVVETLEGVALAIGHMEARNLARTLRLSLALGTPIAESLRQSAGVIRQRRRQAVEQRLNTLSLKLSVCAITLLFPPWLVLVLLPNVLSFMGGNW